jgi:sugar phosphate isomerase/epimerase
MKECMERRTFLTTATAALAAGMLPYRLAAGSSQSATPLPSLQLYTLRRLMATDPAGTLAAVAGIGYRELELAGIYGKTATEFRALLDQNQLTAPSAHYGIGELRNRLDQVLNDSTTLGHKWIVVASVGGTDRTTEGMKRVAESLNQAGAKANERGMRVGYHNHQFEFPVLPEGQKSFDILLQNTDPALVDFQIDLYHIRQGGGDALDYLKRYPKRFFSVHVKDATPDGKMANVGAGVIDFATIFAQANRSGVKYYFIEHDSPADPINDVRASFVATKQLLTKAGLL